MRAVGKQFWHLSILLQPAYCTLIPHHIIPYDIIVYHTIPQATSPTRLLLGKTSPIKPGSPRTPEGPSPVPAPPPVRNGMAWHGIVWHGMARNGMAPSHHRHDTNNRITVMNVFINQAPRERTKEQPINEINERRINQPTL